MLNLSQECYFARKDITKLADVVHNMCDVGTSIPSSSFNAAGKMFTSCLMRTPSAGGQFVHVGKTYTRHAFGEDNHFLITRK